jgi:CheY-like chemotaxis protein
MGEKDRVRRRLNQGWMWILGILAVLFFIQACSSIAYVQLNDRLPARASALEGKKVFLAVEDERKTKDFAGRGVKREFDNFSESIAYSVKKGTEPGLKMGLYDVPSLVREAFRLRVENEGAEIVPEKKVAQVELVFALQEFSLDLVDRNWKVILGYEVRLVKDGAVLSKQFATGEAERLKIMGTEQADVVVADLFADVMNRLNVAKLFRDAGL